MILKLATAYNPGDADPGVAYNYLHIDVIVYSSESFTVSVIYDLGTIDANGNYIKGIASPRNTEQTTQTELASFATTMSLAGEPVLIGTQRLAYQFLVANRNRPGTIDLTLPAAPGAPAAAVASNDEGTSSSSASTNTTNTSAPSTPTT